ncbi:MAG: glutamate-5-semialdehyde dehydrogenase [Clostridia bacterium]|nr:glutamate-5-semialdehyde dehydrogenase [Clostridia bacterium]
MNQAYWDRLGGRAKAAAAVLAQARAQKNAALLAMADALLAAQADILAANAQDVQAAAAAGTSQAMLDRLTLTPARIASMADGLRQVAALPDPVGEVIGGSTRPNGLRILQVRVPLGVLGIIYEARPNVTSDAAGLCLKSGNAVLLRSGKEAILSNRACVAALRAGLAVAGLPEDAVQLVDRTDREAVLEMMQQRRWIDVLIPRGGAGLIRSVTENARIPVLETGVGNCHIYVDAGADVQMAAAITVNAKASRPSVCNAAETLLIHAAAAPTALPVIADALLAAGVQLRCCPRAAALLPGRPVLAATQQDWETEFLDYIMAVRVVDDIEQALAHIARYGTGHSECIVTDSQAAADRFTAAVDAAAVYVNASTRFTDGGEFGMGAEIGISTQKLHARGPMGLRELTCGKYIISGNGQVR